MQSDRTTPPNSVAVDALKSEWAGICDAMNRGTYRGTEAEALARIEAIKVLIAEVAALIAEAEARGMERAADLCAGLADQVSDAALTGLPEQARLRESMESAFTKARHAIRAEAAAIRRTAEEAGT